MFGVSKGHVIQITFDPGLDAAGRPGRHRITHIVTYRPSNQAWQIAVHARSIGTTQGSLQIEYARKPGAAAGLGWVTGLPLDLRPTLGVGIAELEVGQLHGNMVTLDLPLGLGGQLCDGNHRFIKYPG